jgi:hypothetical protein
MVYRWERGIMHLQGDDLEGNKGDNGRGILRLE